MRGFQTLMKAGITLILAIALASCENSVNNSSSGTNGISNHFQEGNFQMLEESIKSIDIYMGSKNTELSGTINEEVDIATLATLLNNAPVLKGEATADFYRILKINNKDGAVVSLEFGGYGNFFKNIDTGVFYSIDSTKELNELIERVEKENVNKNN